MKKISMIVFAALTSLSFASPLFAGPVGVSRPAAEHEQHVTLAQLASDRDEAQTEALRATKGRTATDDRLKAVALQDLIDKVQAGQTVSASEVEQAR